MHVCWVGSSSFSLYLGRQRGAEGACASLGCISRWLAFTALGLQATLGADCVKGAGLAPVTNSTPLHLFFFGFCSRCWLGALMHEADTFDRGGASRQVGLGCGAGMPPEPTPAQLVKAYDKKSRHWCRGAQESEAILVLGDQLPQA